MATKRDPNQISMRLDEDVLEYLEQLRQEDIKGKLEVRASNPELYDKYHGEPVPPTKPELCKRILQEAIRNKAALLKPSGRSLKLVDG